MLEQLFTIYGTGKSFVMALHEGSMAVVGFLTSMIGIAIPADILTIIGLFSMILIVALVFKIFVNVMFKHALIIGAAIILILMFFPVSQA